MLIIVYNFFIDPPDIDHFECSGCGVVYTVDVANLPSQCVVCGTSFEERIGVTGDGT
jgi:rubredoxin